MSNEYFKVRDKIGEYIQRSILHIFTVTRIQSRLPYIHLYYTYLRPSNDWTSVQPKGPETENKGTYSDKDSVIRFRVETFTTTSAHYFHWVVGFSNMSCRCGGKIWSDRVIYIDLKINKFYHTIGKFIFVL